MLFKKEFTEQMKKHSLIIIIVLGILTLTSCLKEDDNYPDLNYPAVSLFNFYPKNTGIVYAVNGNLLNQINPNYKGISMFYAIPGNKKLQVIDRLNNKAIIDTTLTFADSVVYSCMVYGTQEDPEFIRVPDVELKNAGTKTGVRFFHLANGVGKVNFKVGTQEIVGSTNRVKENPSTLAQTQIFRESNTGKTSVTVTDDKGAVLAKIDEIELEKNKHYNFILIGSKGDSNYPLELTYSVYYITE